MPLYDIVSMNGHWVVYVEGKFFCTADSFMEAVREVEKEFGK